MALVARSRDALYTLAAELGNRALAVECDVSEAAGVHAAVATIITAFGGPPRILVNSAGLFHPAPIADLDAAAFDSMLSVNLVAPFRFVRSLLPAMRAAKRGHIVTIGSVADRTVLPGNSGYSASKFGARAVHEVIRTETKGSGVRATLVSPSAVDTPIWNGLTAAARANFPKAEDMLSADDVARAVLYAVTQPETVNVDELRITRS